MVIVTTPNFEFNEWFPKKEYFLLKIQKKNILKKEMIVNIDIGIIDSSELVPNFKNGQMMSVKNIVFFYKFN